MASSAASGSTISTQIAHIAKRLLEEEGGSVPVQRIAVRAESILDIESTDVASITVDTADEISTTQTDDGQTLVTDVGTISEPEPDPITEAFEGKAVFFDLDPIPSELAPIIADLGYHSLEDLAARSPAEFKTEINNHLDVAAPDAHLEQISLVTGSIADSLTNAGYTSFHDLATADADALSGVHTTLTEAKAEKIITTANNQALTVTDEEAKQIVHSAEMELPVGDTLAQKALQSYKDDLDGSGSGAASITQIERTEQTVGDPKALTSGEAPEDHQYVSDIGANDSDPVACGLQVLDDEHHPQVPKAETHPDAGPGALPVDENGDVVAPAVPVEPELQVPVDELVAKALHDHTALRLIGPRGSGKNYLLKYIHHQTNRAYVSIDVDAATTPEDLFGPLTPDENGVIKPRNAAVKQTLINGGTVVLNEFPVMQAGAAIALHRYFNEGSLLIKAHGELIEPHPAARVVITMNPPTVEYRDSEPMNAATRGRFLTYQVPYIQSVEQEVDTLDQQVNSPRTIVDRDTLTKIVKFAHATRDESSYPTLSTRNLTLLCKNIDYGATPKAAVKNELRAVSEPNQSHEATYDELNRYL
ncbi:nitric oxide reductase NorQ protein [Halorientalis persicus]|uniref:Nitric oxide reductase NorQ protein n=1 Tax=Halorientalis persicus TaxID=1367881 RepID=A0A1H8MQB6_9EURY|nr:AAA family ATPase [Halorientalis persicus]SEO19460.1 nitric oxide reductase NorQ protein [Halorientalis persicus]